MMIDVFDQDIRWLIRDPELRAILGEHAYVSSYADACALTLETLERRGVYFIGGGDEPVAASRAHSGEGTLRSHGTGT